MTFRLAIRIIGGGSMVERKLEGGGGWKKFEEIISSIYLMI